MNMDSYARFGATKISITDDDDGRFDLIVTCDLHCAR